MRSRVSQAATVPVSPMSVASKAAMLFLKEARADVVVGRGGVATTNNGYTVSGGGASPAATNNGYTIGGGVASPSYTTFTRGLGYPRGGGANPAASTNNGYSISQVLERLVKDQRNYTFELTSPTSPGSSNHDVKTSCIRVSLVCPLSQQRMKYPSRGRTCKHLQCFDAENYINFHEKQMVRKKVRHVGHYMKPSADKKKWNCPICEKIAHIPQLYIDKALMKLVHDSSASEVELGRNGAWVPVSKLTGVEVIDLTDD